MAADRGPITDFSMPRPVVPQPSARLQQLLEWIAPAHGTPIEAWRHRILAAVLLALVVFGLVAYVPSVWIAWSMREVSVIALDTVAYLAIVATLLARRARYVWRASILVLLTALLAVFFLVGFGFFAAGFEWLMAFPILAAVLLGLRAGLRAVVASALLLLGLGLLIPTGVFPWAATIPPGLPTAGPMWIVNSASALLLTALTTISVGVLFDGLGNEASARLVAEAEAARLASAIEQSDGVVVLLDAQGTTHYSNASAQTLLGDSPSTALREASEHVLRGEPWAGTLLVTTPSGSPLPLSGTISPVRDEQGAVQFFLATLRDVRREQALEQRLQQGQKLEAIGTLAGGIAHDFNNLLQPIVLNTESVQLLLPPDSPAQALLDDVQKAASSARALVRRILTFTRAMEHDRRPLDLGALVRDTERLIRTSLPASVTMESQLEDGIIVLAEPSELQQLLLNLTTNAAHAIPGGGTITMAVTREIVHADTDLAVTFPIGTSLASLAITDSGTGMDAATLARAFEPFFTTKAPGRGSGLGLAMVHGTVTALGGVILPRSTPGRGTTMRVLLPIAGASAAAVAAAAPATPSAHRRRVVLVDDDAAVLQATTRLLQRLGWDVDAFTDPRAAATRLTDATTCPDLLMTDLSMPMMTGLELADHARRHHPMLPIVLATGYLEHDDMHAALGARVDQLLTKPFTSVELHRALDAAVIR
jgi:two-component system, cell cycle sensor histidine kinase and response regulator CckA